MPTGLYLYLKNLEHADAWVSGGLIPLTPASYYRRCERRGIYTPDEVLEVDTFGLPVGLENIIADQFAGGGATFVGCSFRFGGKTGYIDSGHISRNEKDYLIICFSSVLSSIQAKRFGEKRAIVKIQDTTALLNQINAQLGRKGREGFVEYTKGPDRHCFLKSLKDRWQQEFRLAWTCSIPIIQWVDIPKGTAAYVYL